MDALLLEKAEIQQSLSLSRKDLEKTRQQGKVGEMNIYFYMGNMVYSRGMYSLHIDACMFIMKQDPYNMCLTVFLCSTI